MVTEHERQTRTQRLEEAREEVRRLQARVRAAKLDFVLGGHGVEYIEAEEKGDRRGNLRYTEDSTYTKRSTTGKMAGKGQVRGMDQAEIRRELREILIRTLRKLRGGKGNWMKILLKMHGEISELLERIEEEHEGK